MWTARSFRFGAGLTAAGMAFLLVTTAVGQPQFQNLDFESATNLPAPPAFSTAFSNALPGWTGSIGTNSVSAASYDNFPISNANLAVLDNHIGLPGFGPLDGNFSVMIESGDWPAPGYPFPGLQTPASISQTGQVPALTESVRFDATVYPPGALFVMFNSQVLTLAQLGPTSWGADISSYQGMVGELTFGSQPVLMLPPPGDTRDPSYLEGGPVELDNITFSTQPIPEPGMTVLLLSGVVLLALVRRCFRHRAARFDGLR